MQPHLMKRLLASCISVDDPPAALGKASPRIFPRNTLPPTRQAHLSMASMASGTITPRSMGVACLRRKSLAIRQAM